MESDATLLRLWCGGDARAGEALFVRRVGEVTRFFRNKVSDEQDVADLVSQTFLGLTQSRDRFRGDASVRRFVFKIASNVLQTHLRTRYKRAREMVDFSTICIGALGPRTPSSIVMKRRGGQAFVDGLRDLPLSDQILLELKCFEALTSREIAETLERPEGTVRRQLAEATQRLRTLVHARLHGPQDAQRPTVTADDLDVWAADVRVLLGRDPGRGDAG